MEPTIESCWLLYPSLPTARKTQLSLATDILKALNSSECSVCWECSSLGSRRVGRRVKIRTPVRVTIWTSENSVCCCASHVLLPLARAYCSMAEAEAYQTHPDLFHLCWKVNCIRHTLTQKGQDVKTGQSLSRLGRDHSTDLKSSETDSLGRTVQLYCHWSTEWLEGRAEINLILCSDLWIYCTGFSNDLRLVNRGSSWILGFVDSIISRI